MQDRAPKVLLEGRPGVGKTTVLRRLAGKLHDAGVPAGGFITRELVHSRSHPVTDALKRREDVEVIRVSRDIRDELASRLSSFLTGEPTARSQRSPGR